MSSQKGKMTMQRKFSPSFHIPGTLSANIDIRFTVPSSCTLVHVSAVASNDSDALITVGPSTDTDGYIASAVIGDSQVPAEFEDLSDFDGAIALEQYPHIADGTVVCVTLDYDGAGGTAAHDVTIVLTFVEG
jgi:hypothetical protein